MRSRCRLLPVLLALLSRAAAAARWRDGDRERFTSPARGFARWTNWGPHRASEAIDAATRVPAAYFGIRDLGAIAPGQAASFLAVDGDPYQDLRNLGRRRLIVIEGQVIQQDGQ